MVREQIRARVAAGCGNFPRDGILRQNLIDRLARADAERLFWKKVGEGIWQLITGDLQDAFIDRIDDGAGGTAGGHGPRSAAGRARRPALRRW